MESYYNNYPISSSYDSTNCLLPASSSSPLVGGALQNQIDYLQYQLPGAAVNATGEIVSGRRKENNRAVSIISTRLFGTGLGVHGRHLQETSLTNYDMFYSVGSFLLALSYSTTRLFKIRSPKLDCRAADSFRVVDEFSHLASVAAKDCLEPGSGGGGLTGRIHTYEANRINVRINSELGCLLSGGTSSGRKLSMVTAALARAMDRAKKIKRYQF